MPRGSNTKKGKQGFQPTTKGRSSVPSVSSAPQNGGQLLHEAKKYRKIAADAGDKALESFDRSDTDGALSQWGHQLKQRLHLTLAEILENGKKAAFPVLVNDETGEIVPARIIDTRYGTKWAVFESADEANAERGNIKQWVGTTDRSLKNKGYRLAYQKRDAWAGYSGSGGLTSVDVRVYPNDGLKFNPDAPLIEDDD